MAKALRAWKTGVEAHSPKRRKTAISDFTSHDTLGY
jgi:hypothetical protein